MKKNSRIVLLFPLLFILISGQAAWGYWGATPKPAVEETSQRVAEFDDAGGALKRVAQQ